MAQTIDQPVPTTTWSTVKRATALSAIAGSVALVAAFLSPPTGAHACSDSGALIVVPGNNDVDYATGGGLMRDVIDNAGDKDVIVVGYPTTIWPAGAVGHNKNVDMGRNATMQAVTEYQDKCGGKPIEIAGYSQGARVAGDVLSDIGNGRYEGYDLTDEQIDRLEETKESDIKGTLYADSRQNRVVDYAGRGFEQAFLGVIPGGTVTGPRENGFGDLSGNVTSLCSQGDPICSMTDPVKDPLGAVDALLGYFVKHSDYVSEGWMKLDRSESGWSAINDGKTTCSEASGNGGTVCVVEQPSSITRLVRANAVAILGMSDADAAKIPDVYGKVHEVLNLNNVLPNVSIASLQPVVNLAFSALPQLPYVTYNAGGYLPDALTALQLVTGIGSALGGDTGPVVDAAKAIGLSAASMLLIPVNGTIFWGNKLSQLVAGADVFPQNDFTQTVWKLGRIPAETSGVPATIWPTPWPPATGSGNRTAASVSAPATVDFTTVLSKAQTSGVYRAAQKATSPSPTGPVTAQQKATPNLPDAPSAPQRDQWFPKRDSGPRFTPPTRTFTPPSPTHTAPAVPTQTPPADQQPPSTQGQTPSWRGGTLPWHRDGEQGGDRPSWRSGQPSGGNQPTVGATPGTAGAGQ
ncbi:cutinase family protein [Gordonia sp. (in: high G+C Gram-positive bacteria)]|uniref:cutinase family protein n=1 Tax=Gordonia sp. (in: high G+C Gram-positive bacteria) TaxID=84139 RepID=UPI0039E31D54